MIELAGQCAVAVVDLEKPHVRVPRGRLRLADRDAVNRLDDAKQAGTHAVLGKVLLHFLFGKRVPRKLQLLRRIRDVPGFELVEA